MRIPKGVLKIGKCAQEDGEIAPMGAVRVSRTGGVRCVAEATDGKAAVRVVFMEPAPAHLFGFGVDETAIDGVEQLLPAEIAVASDKAITDDPGYAIVDENPAANQVSVVVPGAAQQQRWDAATIKDEARKFPDINAAIQNYRLIDVADTNGSPAPAVRVAVDPIRLSEVLKAVVEAAPGIDGPVFIDVPLRGGRAIQLSRGSIANDKLEVLGLLMPMSDDMSRRRVDLIDGKADPVPAPTPELPGISGAGQSVKIDKKAAAKRGNRSGKKAK